MNNKLMVLDLQFFTGEKTEQATPRRRDEARKKGQVLKSTEVNSLLLLLVTFYLLKMILPGMIGQLQNYTRGIWGNFRGVELTADTVLALAVDGTFVLLRLVIPLLLAAFLIGFISNIAQVGFLFSMESISPDLAKLNPISGFKKLFSKKSLLEMFKSTWKIGLIGYLAYGTLRERMNAFPFLMDSSMEDIFAFVGSILSSIMTKVLGAMVVLVIIDYLFQRKEYEDSLKMSKQEVKEEYKNMEGDPQIKSKIREKQRQMAMQRMMQEIPGADVVITNPTHYAVALKYDADFMVAPIVVAKGVDLVAGRIKKIAKENKIVIVENKELARMIYARVDLNSYIPEDLFQAVAEVLAFVYRLQRKV